jgi:hypothetical protein
MGVAHSLVRVRVRFRRSGTCPMFIKDAPARTVWVCSFESREMISLPRVRYSSSGLLVIWGLVVGCGILLLEGYAARPGDTGSPPIGWPADSPIPRDADGSTLLIFLHSQCPCSRASVEELGYILSRCGRRVSSHALLLSPTHVPGGWSRSAIEQDLTALPDVHTWPDRAGAEARRFRVETSGHVVLYDAKGRLTYSGGITAARGHGGDNDGRAEVIDRILGKAGNQPGSPIFGCPLLTPPSPSGEEPGR